MKPNANIVRAAAICLLAVTSNHVAGQASEPNRRYFNEVFDGYIRTADIVYAEHHNVTTGKREKLTLRLFEPEGDGATKRPLFVLTPGGGFVAHEDHWMDEYGEQLARAGYLVAIHRYRLSDSIATAGKYFNALFKAYADQKAVLDYFAADARGDNRFKADMNNVFIGGHSAGAITSMHVAYLDAGDEIDKAMARALERHGGIGEQGYRVRGVINMSGLVTDPDIIDQGEPALMSMHGDQDRIVPIGAGDGRNGSIPIHQRAEAVGLDNELYVIRGALHNDTADPELCPECIPLTRRFMFNTLKRVGGED